MASTRRLARRHLAADVAGRHRRGGRQRDRLCRLAARPLDQRPQLYRRRVGAAACAARPPSVLETTMMTDDPARALARHVCRIDYADLPASAVESARRDILDTFGCMLGGSG